VLEAVTSASSGVASPTASIEEDAGEDVENDDDWD
jgi:hypothetical protein